MHDGGITMRHDEEPRSASFWPDIKAEASEPQLGELCREKLARTSLLLLIILKRVLTKELLFSISSQLFFGAEN